MNQLVKQVTSILMLLGLESGGVTAASVLVLEDDTFTSAETCVVEPNVQGGFSFATVMFFFMAVFLVILGAWYRLYRKTQDALDSYDHCYTQMAILDSAYNRVQDMYEGLREQHFTDINILDNLVDRHVQEIGALQTQLEATNDALGCLREGHNELQGETKMLCDSSEQVHYGLVQIGGFTSFNDLNPDDRRQMYELERANFVARRVMGADRYLNVIRQQNQGVARGEDTDMVVASETGESEAAENDPAVEPSQGFLTQAVDTLRRELNKCLMRHDYATAAQFQNCIMAILDAINGSVPMTDEVRSNLFNNLGSSLESMADRVRRNLPATAERYNDLSGQLRNMAQTG